MDKAEKETLIKLVDDYLEAESYEGLKRWIQIEQTLKQMKAERCAKRKDQKAHLSSNR